MARKPNGNGATPQVLSRDQIIRGIGSYKTQEVEVEVLGGTVLLRELSGLDMLDMAERFDLGEGNPMRSHKVMELGMWVLPRALVDAAGKPLFTEAEFLGFCERGSREVVLPMVSSLVNSLLTLSSDPSALDAAEKNSEEAISGVSPSA